MTENFNDQINTFIHSLNADQALIHYGAFDFTKVHDSRSQLTQLNYDKNKVSFVNLEMIVDLLQLFAAVHNATQQSSNRDFSVEVPYRLSNTRSVGDALRVFGGYGKPFVIVVSLLDRAQSDELFAKISQIENVIKLTDEQIKESMKKNIETIREYYFGEKTNEKKPIERNLVGEIVTQMIASKNL